MFSPSAFDFSASSIHIVFMEIESPVMYHTVTVTHTDGGKVSPSGSVSVADGDSLVLTIAPDSGYRLSSLSVDGKSVASGVGSYTLKNVSSDHSVDVVFSKRDVRPDPDPDPEPVPEGSLDVIVTNLSGTELRNGEVVDVTGFVPGDWSSFPNGPFRLDGMAPGVEQTASISIVNKNDATIQARLSIDDVTTVSTDDHRTLAEAIEVTVSYGESVQSCTLWQMLEDGWKLDIAEIRPDGYTDIDITISFPPESAGPETMGITMTIKMEILATWR